MDKAMSEREAFEASEFYFTGEDGGQRIVYWLVWQTACKWQREQCALEAEHWQKISQPSHKCGEYIAAAILNQGSKE